MANEQTERPMTVAQTAELLSKDVSTIHNWILLGKDGPFPGAFKLPGGKTSAWLIPALEVQSALQQQKERDHSDK